MRFLFVDRILELVPGQYCRGLKHITADDVYLQPTSCGRFAFSPSLIGETLGQLAAWNVMVGNNFSLRPVAGIVAKATLISPAYLGETLELESFIDAVDASRVQYHSIAKINNQPVFTVEDALGPMLPMSQFIDEGIARRQFAEIYRPVSNYSFDPATPAETLNVPQVTWPIRFDNILKCEPKVSISAEKRISLSAPYFIDHFPFSPVLPMTLLLECKLDLAHRFLEASSWTQDLKIKEMRKIKMSEFVLPGDVLSTVATVKRSESHELVLHFRSEVNGKRVCVVDIVFEKGDINEG